MRRTELLVRLQQLQPRHSCRWTVRTTWQRRKWILTTSDGQRPAIVVAIVSPEMNARRKNGRTDDWRSDGDTCGLPSVAHSFWSKKPQKERKGDDYYWSLLLQLMLLLLMLRAGVDRDDDAPVDPDDSVAIAARFQRWRVTWDTLVDSENTRLVRLMSMDMCSVRRGSWGHTNICRVYTHARTHAHTHTHTQWVLDWQYTVRCSIILLYRQYYYIFYTHNRTFYAIDQYPKVKW